jgi:hypothetical protein
MRAAGQAFVLRQLDAGTAALGDRITASAQSLHSVAGELRVSEGDAGAELAESLAARADDFGTYLKEAGASRLLGDVERVARRAPLAFVAGGLLLGLSASRFLKASGSRGNA